MAANILFDHLGRQRNDRIYRERIDHLEQLREEEVRKRYRFSKENIRFICNLLKDKLQHQTSRSQALSVELQVKTLEMFTLPTSNNVLKSGTRTDNVMNGIRFLSGHIVKISKF